MRPWLTAAAVPLLASSVANAQADPVRGASLHKNHTSPDVKLPTIPEFRSPSAIQDGMIAQEELASNARFGIGLVPMLGHARSARLGQELTATRKPGVVFVIKLGR